MPRVVSMTTEEQYRSISGNWNRYFLRLVNQKNRKALTVEMLENLLKEQEGRCALTGIELTCILEKGNICLTNASIDRIDHGGPYILENIRLICRQANNMRWTLSDEELLYWCKRIVDHNG